MSNTELQARGHAATDMSTHPLFEKVFSGKPEPQGLPLTGEERKRSGMKSAAKHVPAWYHNAFMQAVENLPRGHVFTVEDIRAVVGDMPKDAHYNGMGSLVLAMATKKLAKKTGLYVKAKRPHMNATEIAQWVRL